MRLSKRSSSSLGTEAEDISGDQRWVRLARKLNERNDMDDQREYSYERDVCWKEGLAFLLRDDRL